MPAHDRQHTVIALLIAGILAFTAITLKPGLAGEPDETLLLAVVVNGHPTGKIGEFILRGGALFARPQELHDLGFKLPRSLTATKSELVALSDLPDFSSRLDQATQTLYVTAGMNRLLPALLEATLSQQHVPPVQSGIGATLNYDVIGTSLGNRRLGSGTFDARAFSPWGIASTGFLAYAGADPVGTDPSTAIRLDSTYEYSDPATMRRYRVGDFISGFLSWTRPVRMGGAQITSDFSMRPDLITFPVPVLSGSVAVPSTVDVLVNGSRVLSRQVQPGPFQVPQLPVITGAGTVAMTVTNALGQQVTTQLPFYASPALLRPGLQTYSVEAGAARENWGVVSNDYGKFAAAATYRRGLTNDLTLEGHAEGSDGLVMAGIGGVVNVGNFGVANVAVAGSTGADHSGAQLALGFQHVGPRFSFGASTIIASRNFGDIAAINGDPIAQLQVTANAGLSLGRFGSFGIAYVGVDRAAQPEPIQFIAPPGTILSQTPILPGTIFFQPAEHSHILSASYSVQLARVFLYATAFHDFADGGYSGAMFQLTIPFGSRSSVNAGVQTEGGIQTAYVDAVQTANTIGQWGYHVFGAANDPNHEFAQASYKSRYAMLYAGADRFGNQTTLQAEAQGAVSVIDGGVFATNQIYDSFAVVDTNGVKNVQVQFENRPVGRTDSAGQLLVPDLQSFQVNHLSINPLDMPLSATVPFTKREVRPQDQSGVVIHFPIKMSHGALLRLIDEAGKPMPVNSTATLRSTGVAAPVGYGGETYIVDLKPHNEVIVERPDGRRCAVAFNYRPIPNEIPNIGPLRCRDINQ